MRVIGCSRCGGDHEHVEVTKLERPFAPPECAPVVWNSWAPCPTNGQPIMVSTVHGDLPRDPDVRSGTQHFEDALPIVYQVFQERTASLGSELEAFKSTVREFFGQWKPADGFTDRDWKSWAP